MTRHRARRFELPMIRALLFFAAMPIAFGSTPLSAQSQAAQTHPSAAPKVVDLRANFNQWDLPIKPQGRRDTCAVFTLTGALEFALAKGTQETGWRFSEEYLNWAADEIAATKFDGASYEDLIAAFDKWGICAENFLPYYTRYDENLQPSQNAFTSAKGIWKLGFRRHWIARRTENGLTDSHIQEMRRVLASGWPLCAYGRDHSILIVGFQDDAHMNGGGQFITRNSATQRYETIFYAASKDEFGSVLWIELPQKKSEAEQ